MEEPADLLCHEHIDDAGLSHRPNLMLMRDRELYARMLRYLLPGSGRDAVLPPLTTRALVDGLRSEEWAKANAAAFLVGRSRAADADADRRLTEATRAALATIKDPQTRSELAMSLALRGDPEAARVELRERIGDKPAFMPWIAAAYLAQLGDVSGWKTVVYTAGENEGVIEANRMASMEASLAFLPHQGTVVDGLTIDPGALVAERAKDSQPIVRRMVPFLIVATGSPDAMRILDELANDPEELVREMAVEAKQRALR